MQPAVFLDRDNTLIDNGGDLGDPAQVRLLDGVAAGLKALRQAGFGLVVVTNQAGVARGKFTEQDVDAVNQRIATLVDDQARSTRLIDRFYYCPYHPEATLAKYKRDHPWRKPHPGMILQAARDMSLDLSQSWMIGDQERDVMAARSAGCRIVLVTQDAGLIQRTKPTEVAATFLEAAQCILRQPPHRSGLAQNNASQPVQPPPRSQDLSSVGRVVSELIEEIRSDRLRRSDFTILRMVAVICQLLAVLLALLGLLQLNNIDMFAKWMIGAGLVQLFTIALLVLDLK